MVCKLSIVQILNVNQSNLPLLLLRTTTTTTTANYTTTTTVLAIQDKVVATRVIEAKIIPSLMCRLCGGYEENIFHLLAACMYFPIAASEYLYHHNLVAGLVHWHIMRIYGLPLSSCSWFTHKPPPVLEASVVKILWDFSFHSSGNHPVVVVVASSRASYVHVSLFISSSS